MHRPLMIMILICCPWPLASCGGDRATQPDATSDIDQGTLVTGTVATAPALVAYREATETEWKPVNMKSPTSFQFYTRKPYLVTVVCEWEPFVWVQQLAQSPTDPADLDVWCDHSEGPHLVTGSVLQPSEVSMGDIQTIAETSFKFKLRTGTFDIIAKSAGRIAIRRDVEISGETPLTNPIDTSLEGAALIPTSFTLKNASPIEQLIHPSAILVTRNGYFALALDNLDLTEPIAMAPNSLLTPSDYQAVVLGQHTEQYARWTRRKYREGDSTVFMLPDRIEGITFSQTGDKAISTWMTLPAHARIQGQLNGISADSSTAVHYYMRMSRTFESSMSVSSMALDTTIPGYRPQWRIDFSKEYHQALYVESDAGNDTLGSGAFISMNNTKASIEAPASPPHTTPWITRPLRAP